MWWISLGYQCQHRSPGTFIFHVDTDPFTFHASLPRLELAVHDEHQVVKEPVSENIQRRTSARRQVQHWDEEQWTNDRSLVNTNTNSDTKVFTLLTNDSHTAAGIWWQAQDDPQSPFIDTKAPLGPSQDLPWRNEKSNSHCNSMKSILSFSVNL